VSLKDKVFTTLICLHVLAIPIGLIGSIVASMLQPHGYCLYGPAGPHGGSYMGDWCEPRWWATAWVVGVLGTGFWAWVEFEGFLDVLKWIAVTLFVMLWVLLLATDGKIITG
jgi:hypothetical protein